MCVKKDEGGLQQIDWMCSFGGLIIYIMNVDGGFVVKIDFSFSFRSALIDKRKFQLILEQFCW